MYFLKLYIKIIHNVQKYLRKFNISSLLSNIFDHPVSITFVLNFKNYIKNNTVNNNNIYLDRGHRNSVVTDNMTDNLLQATK